MLTFSLLALDESPLTLTASNDTVNNGNWQVNLQFPSLRITDPAYTVSFNYHCVNAAGAPSGLANALAKAAESALAAGIGALLGGFWTGVAGAILGYLGGHVLSFFEDYCNGPVAAGQYEFTGQQLWNLTQQSGAGGSFSAGDYCPGTDSNWGCGSNSQYTVTWSIYCIPDPVVVGHIWDGTTIVAV